MATVTSVTTAKLLGEFHRELVAEEIPEDTIHEVFLMAAHELISQSGLAIEEVSA